jgi:hypothetical protein
MKERYIKASAHADFFADKNNESAKCLGYGSRWFLPA